MGWVVRCELAAAEIADVSLWEYTLALGKGTVEVTQERALRGDMRFRWLGVAGIELSLDGQTLVIDPFFSRFPFWRMWVGRVSSDRELVAAKIQRCDYVLVTHAHWDHLMDVPEVVRNTGAVAFGSANTCHLLRVLGVPGEQIREISIGNELDLGGFEVQVLPGEHETIWGRSVFSGPIPPGIRPPLGARDYRMDSCFSFLVSAGGRRLLDWFNIHPGPAALAEVLFVGPLGSRDHYESLLGVVRPKVVIPLHWDDLFRPLSKPLRPMLAPPAWRVPPLQRMNLGGFAEMIEGLAPGTKVLVPEVLRAYDLSELV